MAEQHIVSFWRGTRDSYNALVKDGLANYWTRYSVTEYDGTRTEYFGKVLITIPTGQLRPVDDIVSSLPSDAHEGARYLVGHDADSTGDAEYYVYEVHEGGNVVTKLGDLSVRVKSKGLWNFQVVDGRLYSYDQYFDCGEF